MALILAVDDDGFVLATLEHMLEMNGYEVITAADGCQAMEYLTTCSVDLVITDDLMDRMDGFDLTHEMRRTPATWDIPIIMVAQLDSPGHELEAKRAGVAAYIPKPLKRDRLIMEILRLLKERV